MSVSALACSGVQVLKDPLRIGQPGCGQQGFRCPQSGSQGEGLKIVLDIMYDCM